MGATSPPQGVLSQFLKEESPLLREMANKKERRKSVDLRKLELHQAQSTTYSGFNMTGNTIATAI